jgi:hypothetical protein
MEAIRSSETSGTTQRTTRRYIPEEDTLLVTYLLNLPVVVINTFSTEFHLTKFFYDVYINIMTKGKGKVVPVLN